MCIPTNAQEAKAQGWNMVCVLPQRLKPDNLIELILPHFEQSTRDVKFTYKGRAIETEGHGALWVKDFKWSIEGRNVLLSAFFNRNTQLYRFIREVMAVHMPGFILSQDATHLSHAAHMINIKEEVRTKATTN